MTKSTKLPRHHNMELSFWSLSLCLDILIKCLKSQKSQILVSLDKLLKLLTSGELACDLKSVISEAVSSLKLSL